MDGSRRGVVGREGEGETDDEEEAEADSADSIWDLVCARDVVWSFS